MVTPQSQSVRKLPQKRISQGISSLGYIGYLQGHIEG